LEIKALLAAAAARWTILSETSCHAFGTVLALAIIPNFLKIDFGTFFEAVAIGDGGKVAEDIFGTI